jgi:hypothetical protein
MKRTASQISSGVVPRPSGIVAHSRAKLCSV